MTQSVLILGGTGRFGRHATAAFSYAGWQVSQFDRATQSLWDAAWGADVIVNAWNPFYPDWATQIPILTQQVIEVAKATGATVILPGNVYVYGTHSDTVWGSDTPHHTNNPYGKIRIEMEAAYRDAGVRTILLRAGDFIDTRPSGNWFDAVITRPLNRGRIAYPGALDTPHAWAWLPDMADAAVQLADRRNTLAMFEDIPFPGYTLTGHQLAAAISAAQNRNVIARKMSWLLLRLAAPFWPMGRALLDMRYLWDTPHQLDDSKLRALLPDFTPTDLVEALRITFDPEINPDQFGSACCLSRTAKRGVIPRPQNA